MKVMRLLGKVYKFLDWFSVVDFLGPLALRLYLAPIFWMAGINKWQHMENTVNWFGNKSWGLGLPFPWIMAHLATGTEIIGAICLLFGIATRLVCFPLLITMLVAAFKVHWKNGWSAIAESGTTAATKLQHFLTWLKSAHPSHYESITAHGKLVILNNGIEFAITYMVMVLVLFFIGGGKYVSVDYWVRKFT